MILRPFFILSLVCFKRAYLIKRNNVPTVVEGKSEKDICKTFLEINISSLIVKKKTSRKHKERNTTNHWGQGRKKKDKKLTIQSLPIPSPPKNINTLPQESHFKHHLQKEDSPPNHRFPPPALCGPTAQCNITQLTSTSNIKYY